MCRTKFDQSFKKRAQAAGATIKTQHSFIRKEGRGLIIKNKTTQNNSDHSNHQNHSNHKNHHEFKIIPDLVIAADGPLSKTAKAYGFYEKTRKNYYGIQAVVEKQHGPNNNHNTASLNHFNKDTFITYFRNDWCPDFFIWDVPENKQQSRVGLASKKPPKKFFQKFIQDNNFEIKQMQAGVIPIYSHKQKMQKDNCYLLGDAAGHVKATTLGGLIPGLRAAKILSQKIQSNTYKVGGYHKALNKLRRELLLHKIIRNLMDHFTNNDWDKLLSLVSQKKIQKVFEKYSRDNPIPLTFFSLIKEPRFLYFTRHLPKLILKN